MLKATDRFVLAATLVVLAAGCAANKEQVKPEAPAQEGEVVVATWGEGSKITLSELRAHVDDQLAELRKQEQQILKRGLEGLLIERLVNDAAKQRGLTQEEYLKAEIDQKLPQPSEEELRQLYEGAKDQLPEGSTFEQVRPQIVDYLTGEARQTRARELFEELKTGANVKLSLPEPPRPEPRRVEVAATGPSKGPKDAPITIVEFSDFQCPFCGRANRTVNQVMEKYKDQVRLVFRNFPLSFHAEAQKAAEAALCAHDQDKFWQYHDVLFERQSALGIEDLKKYATELGLDAAKFNACLDEGQKAAQVKADMDAGTKAGVEGTPAFFINGVELAGAQPLEEFEAVIDAELSRAPAPAR